MTSTQLDKASQAVGELERKINDVNDTANGYSDSFYHLICALEKTKLPPALYKNLQQMASQVEDILGDMLTQVEHIDNLISDHQ